MSIANKKRKISILTLCLICANCFATTNESVNSKHPNHFYIGPEVFAFDLHTHVKDVKVHGVRYFAGPLLRYEYLKPKALYAGVEFLGAWGNKDFKSASRRYKFQGNGPVGFGNFELRLGYTFEQKSGLVSPYLGTGFYGFGNSASNEILVYFAAGMRSLFELSQSFSMGLNLKLQFAPRAERELKYRYEGHRHRLHQSKNLWGGEVGVPLVWYLTASKRWEAQFEPYFLSLDFTETQNIYGARLLFGYRF
jgi:hypothetical protein